MWVLGRWNTFYQEVEDVDWRDNEADVRETLQIWIEDEYANKNIDSYSEEYDADLEMTVITVNKDEFYIWEEK